MSPTLLRFLTRRRWESRRETARCSSTAQQPVLEGVSLMFVELDGRQNGGYTVSLQWNRDTGTTQIVVGDIGTARRLAFAVPPYAAGDAFRHPFRYAPVNR